MSILDDEACFLDVAERWDLFSNPVYTLCIFIGELRPLIVELSVKTRASRVMIRENLIQYDSNIWFWAKLLESYIREFIFRHNLAQYSFGKKSFLMTVNSVPWCTIKLKA